MAAGDIRAGGAFVEIFTKDAALMKGLNKAAGRFKAWGATMVAIGRRIALASAAAGAAIFGTLKIFADEGGKLTDMAARTGVAVETLQELGYAAEQTGASMGDVEKALRFMAKTAGSIDLTKTGKALIKEQEKAARTFPATAKGLRAAADELNNIRDPGEKAARAMEIFGKSGTSILPMLEGGAAGLKKYTDRARELGIVQGKDAVKAADDFGDSMGDLWKQVKAVAFQVGNALAPMLSDLIKKFQESLAVILDWMKQPEAAWAAVKVVWTEGTNAVLKVWTDFTAAIEVAWVNVFEKISSIFSAWLADALDGLAEVGRFFGVIDDATANAASNARQSENARRQRQIADDAQRAREAAVGAASAERTNLDGDLKRAQEELRAAMYDAKKSSGFPDSASLVGGPGGKGYLDVPGITGQLKGFSTRGIFNPQAIQSLQGRPANKEQQKAIDAMERAAKAAEKAVEIEDEQTALLTGIKRGIENLNTGLA